MTKLVLKKDVVERIDNGSMNQLKGGVDTYNVCYTMGTTCPGQTPVNRCTDANDHVRTLKHAVSQDLIQQINPY